MRVVLGILFCAVLFGAPISGRAADKVILALGDSITAGAPAHRSPAEVPPKGAGNPQSQYAYWIEQRFPAWRVANRGISGQTTTQIRARLERELDTAQPQFVILMAGVNDIFRGYSAEVVRANLEGMVQSIRSRGLPVFLLTILPYHGLSPEKSKQLEEINRWILDYAATQRLGFYDTFSLMRTQTNPPALVSTGDGLHPDTPGYRRMGEAIAEALQAWPVFQELSK